VSHARFAPDASHDPHARRRGSRRRRGDGRRIVGLTAAAEEAAAPQPPHGAGGHGRLPHGLVEAFKATLEEVILADFLIHVIDVANPNATQHHETTLAVLKELGAVDKPIITVFNKLDAADEAALNRAHLIAPDALFISARSGKNLDQLVAACLEQIADALDAVELLVPHTRYDVIAKLHATGHVQFEESREKGVFIQGRFAPAQAGLFKAYLVKQ
jgi:GTP-binding protein HflX